MKLRDRRHLAILIGLTSLASGCFTGVAAVESESETTSFPDSDTTNSPSTSSTGQSSDLATSISSIQTTEITSESQSSDSGASSAMTSTDPNSSSDISESTEHSDSNHTSDSATSDANTSSSIASESTSTETSEESTDPVPAKMISIPSGTFEQGSNPDDQDASNDEMPAFSQNVLAFELDETEVTVEAYSQCVNDNICSEPDLHSKDPLCNYGASGREDHPINCVDWNQADAFCRWAGKRLPEEMEWEFAARGEEGRIFPWGSAKPDCTRIVEQECAEDGTWAVRSKPQGNTPTGVADMAGNVWEWVQTCWYSYPSGTPDCTQRIARGGGINGSTYEMFRAANRDKGPPQFRAYNVGFRCAR